MIIIKLVITDITSFVITQHPVPQKVMTTVTTITLQPLVLRLLFISFGHLSCASVSSAEFALSCKEEGDLPKEIRQLS